MLLKAGDRIIMTKRMVGAESLLGKEFNVIDVTSRHIVFGGENCRYFITHDDFMEYFTKVAPIPKPQKPKEEWGDWKYITSSVKYRRKKEGNTLQVRDEAHDVSAYCKPCEDDTFSLGTGIKICLLKIDLILARRERKDINREIHEIEKELKNF